ncbi:sporulation YhaL family protein [Sporolactobacillus putidus]|uniref:Uncharacterized protein n=1 Tax=Sporolactobacillus putidus TaxID=492735 RepID=A0A917VXU7_9BACL|nr:sporulation YhaL family protein [Sporolactobacillus putidus]GGL42908.1 hypothetical protein GCM10007968_03540 [Sporolactobacillus putidus]
MKQVRRSLYAVVLLFMLFMMQQLGLIDPILSKIEGVAWWVYLLIAGILFSGYQAFSISREDKEIDDEWVEKQGSVYMKRMEAEKERRNRNKDPKAML